MLASIRWAWSERRQQKLTAAGFNQQVDHIVGDARQLTALTRTHCSAALVMGPLYHLIYETDRMQVLTQVNSRLRPGGILFTASISRYGILGDLMRSLPDWIEREEEVRSVMTQGHDPVARPHQGFRGYFATVEELRPLHEKAGFETLTLAAVEPAISADDQAYNQLQGKRRQAWLDLLFQVSTQPATLGASRHLLYIGRKAD